MNIEDIYYDFPQLMTPEEKEEFDFEQYDDAGNQLVQLLSYPRWAMQHCCFLARPEKDTKKEFKRRKPALGFSKKQIEDLRAHYNDPRLLPVQKRMFFSWLQSSMHRQLISTDGCQTVEELFAILQAEIHSNTPASVPDWYQYTKITHGPRETGYYSCENRNCHRTETVDGEPFEKCSKCKLARYCGRECQIQDWKARHKKICKEAKKNHDMAAKAGATMQMFQRMFDG